MSQPDIPVPVQRTSPWGALLSVLIDPAQTFAKLAPRPPVFPGYAVQMVLTLIYFWLMLPFYTKVVEQSIDVQGQPAEVATVLQVIIIISLLAAAIFTPWVSGLVVALFCLAHANISGLAHRPDSHPIGFANYLGLAGYARIPVALGSVIQGLVSMNATSLQEMESISISLAAVFPPDANIYLKTFLATLNPFDAWYFVLLAIGYAALFKVKPAKSIALLCLLYSGSLLLMLAMTSLG